LVLVFWNRCARLLWATNSIKLGSALKRKKHYQSLMKI